MEVKEASFSPKGVVKVVFEQRIHHDIALNYSRFLEKGERHYYRNETVTLDEKRRVSYKVISSSETTLLLKVNFTYPDLVSVSDRNPDFLYITFEKGIKPIKLKIPHLASHKHARKRIMTTKQAVKAMATGSIIFTLILSIFASQALKFIWPLYNTLQLILVFKLYTKNNPTRPDWDRNCEKYSCIEFPEHLNTILDTLEKTLELTLVKEKVIKETKPLQKKFAFFTSLMKQ
jgi:hypothetical protein